MDDRELMLRVKGGDDAAFDQLMTAHRDKVLRFLYRRVGNAETAEDLAQETFLRVYRARERYEPMAQFTTWLYRIANNLAVSYFRQQARHRQERLPRLADDRPTPDEALTAEETTRRVWNALEALPDAQRTALVLTRFEDCSYQQAAEIMGVTTAALRSLIARARETLRRRLRGTIAAAPRGATPR